MWIVFEDSIADQHAYPIENINAIFITSTTNITVYARNPVQSSEDVSDDTIALTCTADTTDEVLKNIINSIGYPDRKVLIISSAAEKYCSAINKNE